MPKLTSKLVQVTTANNYRFTATKIEDLGATEYTLVTVICDTSGSVSSWRADLERCIQSVLASCRANPRSGHLLLRLCSFSDSLRELHGFKEVQTIDSDAYRGILKISGCTALYEASFEGVDASAEYGRRLTQKGFAVNGIVFILTDGQDNRSRRKPAQLKALLQKIRTQEILASLTTVLVGVTHNDEISNYLTQFKNEAELDQYVDLGGATRENLALLAGLISQSISRASVSLTAGTPPMALQF